MQPPAWELLMKICKTAGNLMAFDYTKYRTKQIQEALLRKQQEKAKQKGPCSSLNSRFTGSDSEYFHEITLHIRLSSVLINHVNGIVQSSEDWKKKIVKEFIDTGYRGLQNIMFEISISWPRRTNDKSIIFVLFNFFFKLVTWLKPAPSRS